MKKGSGFGMAVVVSILLIVIGIVLFSPFFEGIIDLITKGGKSAACKFSLFQGKGTAKCPIEEVFIFRDEVTLEGERFVAKGAEGTQNMAKEALAKLLTMCFSRGGGYNSRAFSTEDWVETESVCLQCFKVKVDEKVGIVQDFTGYLRDTKVKGTIPKKKYLEVLTKDTQHLKAYMEYGMGLGLAPSQGTFEFQPSKEYTIFFIGLKKGYFPKAISQAWNAATLDFFKLFFGNQDTYFTYIVESNKLKNACDRLVN